MTTETAPPKVERPPIKLERFIAFDTETDGLDPATNRVLTIAAAIVDVTLATEEDPFPIIDRFESGIINVPLGEFYDKPDPNGDPNVPFKYAADVNGITRAQVEAGVDHATAWQGFIDFVKKHTTVREDGKEKRPTPFGQNLRFDRGFLSAELGRLAQPIVLDHVVDYHDLDLMSLTAFEMLLGLPSAPKRMSLVDQTKAFGVPHKAHDAMGDVEACCELMRRRITRAREGWYKPA